MSCDLNTNLSIMSNCDAISPDLAKMIQDMIHEEMIAMGNRIMSRISVPIKTIPKVIEDDGDEESIIIEDDGEPSNIVEDLDSNDRFESVTDEKRKISTTDMDDSAEEKAPTHLRLSSKFR